MKFRLSPILKVETTEDMLPRAYLGRLHLLSEQTFDPKHATLHRSSYLRVKGRIYDRGNDFTHTGIGFGSVTGTDTWIGVVGMLGVK